jgi:hypothetical protein
MNSAGYARETRRYASAQRTWDNRSDPMQEAPQENCRECGDTGCEECDGIKRCVGDNQNPCDGCGDCKEEE